MTARASLIAAIFACSALYALPSRAEPARAAAFAPRVAQEQDAPGRHWYGWQTLSLDAASFTLAALGTQRFDEHRASGLTLSALGFGGYVLGAPAVHWSHARPGSAALSLGLRVGVPLLSVGVLSAGSSASCPARSTRDDEHYCEHMETTLLVVGSVSMLAVSLVDAVAVAWDGPGVRTFGAAGTARRSTQASWLSWTPVVGFEGSRGGQLGLVGAF